MKILGIDEAGRGALLGPLVIGGFMIDEERLSDLEAMGVTDSKQLTPAKRKELYEWLKSNGECMTIKVSPLEIDMKNKAGINLNSLEISKMIKIINELKPDKVIIDSPSRNEARIKALFESRVNCEVIAECKADANYRVVGAGSILAKHERDEEVKQISKEVGEEVGIGYPSDERTISFARKAIKSNQWQSHLRHSWETYSRLKREQEQRTITDY